MTLHIRRLRASLRAPAAPVPVYQDRSLAYVLWLLLFLVFAPMIGVHVAFLLYPDMAEARSVQDRSNSPGKHG
ncbi:MULTISPECIES: hypothetical protein [Microvirga]|uniref:hypothetical protein n=1 Tax=Microvirga TaxID=186650 RepID=UPI000E0DA847|nr:MULTISPECIES: hypothetical protein [Microvirga]MBQ0819955.1 hypothetical protein [Microvirga sp. HBU67558]